MLGEIFTLSEYFTKIDIEIKQNKTYFPILLLAQDKITKSLLVVV